MAAVRKGNQWGFIDKTGKLVIDFRADLAWNKNADINMLGIPAMRCPQFKEGLCIIKEFTDKGIPLYGFIDTKGERVIKPEYVNIALLDGGYAAGIYAKKMVKGENEFQLKIFKYNFTEVLVNEAGKLYGPFPNGIT